MPEAEVSSPAVESSGTTRPATFEQAFAQAEATPTPQADRESAPPASTTSGPDGQPDATAPAPESVQDVASKKGPLPFDVHTKALENARTKTRAEVAAEYQQRYGWADGIAPEIGTQVLDWARRAAADPLTFGTQLVEELLAHPTHGPAMRSSLGRYLATGRTNGHGHDADDAEPQPDLQIPGADGQQFLTYTDKQLAKREAWLIRQVEKKFEGRLAPIEQDRQQAATQRQADKIKQESDAYANDFATRLEKIPQFKPHFGAIVEKMTANPKLSEWEAAFEVLTETILPTLGRTEQGKLLADLKQTAVASTVSPSQGHAPAKRYTKPSVSAFAEALGVTQE